MESVVSLPLVLPPTVLGFYLLMAMGRRSPLGRWWTTLTGHSLAFTFEGLVIASVFYSLPFAVQPITAAFAQVDTSLQEASATLGAGRLRILVEILVPQVMPTLVVGLILSFVTMMSVLSVPLMISGESPTMMTVDMAFRINNYGDYGTANALGFISYLMTAACAWIYLKRAVRQG